MIYITCDHAGFDLKQKIVKYFDKNKLWEKGTIYRPIDFVYNEGNKELWDKHMIISNTFSSTQYKYLTNKASLYKTIKELEPENYNKFIQIFIMIICV